jgi:hypothetical protein
MALIKKSSGKIATAQLKPGEQYGVSHPTGNPNIDSTPLPKNPVRPAVKAPAAKPAQSKNDFDLMQAVKGLGTGGQKGPELTAQDFLTNFQPIMSYFANLRGAVNTKSAYHAMMNAAQVIDTFVNSASDKNAALATIKTQLDKLKALPVISSSSDMQNLSLIYQFSKALGGRGIQKMDISNLNQAPMANGPGAAPRQSPHNAAEEHIDIKRGKEELTLASDIIKGIAEALKKPNANKRVLLSRLNKYRLSPMAKLFGQLVKKANMTNDEKAFLSDLKGLFVQADQTFDDSEKDVLKSDPEVKTALESIHTINLPQVKATRRIWESTVKKFSSKY